MLNSNKIYLVLTNINLIYFMRFFLLLITIISTLLHISCYDIFASSTIKNTITNNSQKIEKKTIKTKLLIIGSGPAGYTAAIYAGRATLEPTLVSGEQLGGQLMTTSDVENYPGFEEIKGPDLMHKMQQQAKKTGAKIINNIITKVDFNKRPFKAWDSDDNLYEADSIIIATGATAKWLGLPSEKYFQGHGVSGCATCDGILFANKSVIVVGGGNSAVEEAIYLTHHAKKVTLIHRRDKLRADKTLQKRLFNNPKISVVWNHELVKILGNKKPRKVTRVKIQDVNTKTTQILDCDGVFISIGHHPNTELFKEQIIIDEDGYIITKPGTTQTNIPGIFASGDVQDKIYRQAVTATGTGCIAALEAEKFLQSLSD